MNRVTGVIVIILIACQAIAAQQDGKFWTQSSQSTDQRKAPATTPTFIFKCRWQIELPQSAATSVQPQQTMVIGPPQFVVRDGAVFLDVLGNGVLIPMPGGGASGCFGWDSERKFYELRQTFHGFPARRQSNTATQK